MLYVRLRENERRVILPGGRLAAVPGIASALKDALRGLRREAQQETDRQALASAAQAGDVNEVRRLTRKVIYAAERIGSIRGND